MSAKHYGILFLIVCMLLCMCCGAHAEGADADLEARYFKKARLDCDGETYTLRSRLTSILLIGVDKETGEEKAIADYRNGGQADFLLLIVVDDNRDTVTAIQINRDTMAEITTLSALGEETGTRQAQICLSHGYGDGKSKSCNLTVQAVRNLLWNVPIDHFIAMNMDAISTFNDAIGGVEVTLEDDFTAYDPSMTAGKTLTLQGKQAEYYLQYRYNVGQQTNLSRLDRQYTYLQTASGKAMRMIQETPMFAGKLFNLLKDSLVTDVSSGFLINLANKVRRYEVMPILKIDGETKLGESGFVEFYPDRNGMREVVRSAFCEDR